MKTKDLAKIFSELDPELDVKISVWIRTPGCRVLPKRLAGEFREPRKPSLARKFSDQQLAVIRKMARESTFLAIGEKFGVHRSTISRYIKLEFKAGRMMQVGRGFVECQGAYDMETERPL